MQNGFDDEGGPGHRYFVLVGVCRVADRESNLPSLVENPQDPITDVEAIGVGPRGDEDGETNEDDDGGGTNLVSNTASPVQTQLH
ncbi:hypothetical protein PM082_003380 [Marasmius tenuissimus]|nr:hypothetical protein PM082_003380 [Marasmius tenuissimus]